tara:strand:+ start:1325 stop:1705 length:381 start_codon:yes stop_codon:yes gene_type:complete
MAIVNKGTKLSIPSRQLPDGIGLLVARPFADFQYKRTLEVSVLKSGVEQTTQASTLNKIVTQAAVGVEAQVLTILTEDFVATEDVEYWTDVVSLTSTNTPDGSTDPWLTDVAPSYVMNIVIYVKSN